MGARVIETEIRIDCRPHVVYDYVTVPALWHEWHPASESATGKDQPLNQGDSFEEWASLRPLGPLPLVLRRHIRYRVVECSPPTLFEVTGVSNALDLRIRYDLAETDGGTRFRRRLTYRVHGWLSLVEPILVRPRMQSQSKLALANLKRVLEEWSAAHLERRR